jgi:hypothetical protein
VSALCDVNVGSLQGVLLTVTTMSIDLREVPVIKINHVSRSNKFLKRFAFAVLFIGLIGLIGNFQGSAVSQDNWSKSALRGKVAMTEFQLKKLVESKKLTVYWVGPLANNLYTLNTSKPSQIILTYLPQKNESKSVIADSRVVGTYWAPNAFADSLNFAERTTGVFVAMPNTNYQIEIYDPIPGQAISIASLRDQLTKIGS